MTLFFTGFGPFGDVTYNPSWDCAQAAARVSDGIAELLPVTLDAAREQLDSTPDAALRIHFGVATRRDWVSLERYAHNWWKDLGEVRPRRLLEGAPVALESAVPLSDWAGALDGAADLEWRVSHDAGTYVCNATLFHTLRHTGDALFVHVPPVEPDIAVAIGEAIGSLEFLRDFGGDVTRI